MTDRLTDQANCILDGKGCLHKKNRCVSQIAAQKLTFQTDDVGTRTMYQRNFGTQKCFFQMMDNFYAEDGLKEKVKSNYNCKVKYS